MQRLIRFSKKKKKKEKKKNIYIYIYTLAHVKFLATKDWKIKYLNFDWGAADEYGRDVYSHREYFQNT